MAELIILSPGNLSLDSSYLLIINCFLITSLSAIAWMKAKPLEKLR